MVSLGFPVMSAFISMATCLGSTDRSKRSWKNKHINECSMNDDDEDDDDDDDDDIHIYYNSSKPRSETIAGLFTSILYHTYKYIHFAE